MKFQKILKNLLKENKTSIQELSKKIDVPVKTLQEWLSGRTPRDLHAVKKCADLFGISMQELLFGEHDRHSIFSKKETIVHFGIYEITVRKKSENMEKKENSDFPFFQLKEKS